MQNLSKAVSVGVLACWLGSLAPAGFAQDYVDLEAERAAAKSGVPATTAPTTTAPATSAPSSTATAAAEDPYSARPAQAYPTTSYGANTSGSAGSTTALPAPTTSYSSATPAGSSQGQNVSTLVLQLQQLQQDVRMLNGKVEEQAYELRRLKEQSLERYVDLDRRVAAGAGAASVATGSTSAATSTAVANQNQVAEQPGEAKAYQAAYALVRQQQFDDAVNAFKRFLQDYPAGSLAANAHYWLGELYLVIQPSDLESSRQAFMLLLSQYPDNSKAPDAMYKLGKVHFMKGNREKSREYLDRVIRDYSASNSSAVKLAQDFISENF